MDRFRDRWPMSLLVSRSRLFNEIEENKPRDVIAALKNKNEKGGLAILAEVFHICLRVALVITKS